MGFSHGFLLLPLNFILLESFEHMMLEMTFMRLQLSNLGWVSSPVGNVH
jgi:hypothetical protein